MATELALAGRANNVHCRSFGGGLPVSAGRFEKRMNTETYSLNYTDLNAMTRWSDM